MDLKSVCRTCLKTNNLNPIFKPTQPPEKYSAAIYTGIGLQVKQNDKLPQNMCAHCIIRLNNALQFRKRCHEVERYLLRYINDTDTSKVTIQSDILINSTDIKTKPVDIDIEKQLKTYILTDLSYTPENEYITDSLAKNSDDTTMSIKEEPSDEENYEIGENFVYIPEVNNTELETESKSKKKKLKQQNNLIKKQPKRIKINKDNELDENSIVLIKQEVEVPYNIVEGSTAKVARVVCKLCQKELSIRSIDAHMEKTHPGADERKVQCNLCDRYIMRNQLNRHHALMHDDENVIKCLYCKKEFKTKELLLEHVKSCNAKKRQRKVNDPGRLLASCDVCQKVMQRASLKHCGRSFGNKLRLQEHYRAKHGYEKFKCSYCDFTSASILALKNHERRHRGEKPYVCETCGAKFHASYLLCQHRHSHKTEKLVKCPLCPATFKAAHSLHRHRLSCHSARTFRCGLCARAYSCRDAAARHVRHAHAQPAGAEASVLLCGDS
ncbi:unnamed protein product [Chrysodeixis includens]|uniref:Uncharacterized protein n=1 Tax=Chrysodeixis includens TaxID=689277 RepID=A0A9P0C0G5_CHRIL|nr:unnamed protein product [Chrysodeixis includens]